jgi:hypothetical protein
MASPIHTSILSHRAGIPESRESGTQFERVAGIFVRKFTAKIAVLSRQSKKFLFLAK